MKSEMLNLEEHEMAALHGGAGALSTFGAQLASDGLRHAESKNPAVSGMGVIVAAAGGWAWAVGEFLDGVEALLS